MVPHYAFRFIRSYGRFQNYIIQGLGLMLFEHRLKNVLCICWRLNHLSAAGWDVIRTFTNLVFCRVSKPILGHNVTVHLIRCQEGKRQNWLQWTLGNWKSPHFFIANQFWWEECWQFPEWFTYFVGWWCVLLLIFSVNLHPFYYSNLKVKLWPRWPQFDHCQYPWRILTVLLYMVCHGSQQYTP